MAVVRYVRTCTCVLKRVKMFAYSFFDVFECVHVYLLQYVKMYACAFLSLLECALLYAFYGMLDCIHVLSSLCKDVCLYHYRHVKMGYMHTKCLEMFT